ncbi:T9SS type A sorting domain-containing protein [candidate division WOR-3 bacterium]|nr:T9SS type A sorting domain-containing protein [candidate division WOR-3 bacterium]
MTAMPSGAKQIKDGGWLAYDPGGEEPFDGPEAGTGLIYAARGNKSPDFFSYNPAKDSWKALTSWPNGTEGKPPGKGSVGCADGNGRIYAAKGNNKLGWWEYDAATNAWKQLKDVPLGPSNKAIKGGSSAVWAYKGGVGNAYLLKGYKNEFFRYDPAADAWQPLKDAPGSPKYDKGSWIAYDGGNIIYAHKAKLHEFFPYYIAQDSWGGPLTGMPTSGSGGSKKAKDGSCATTNPSGVLYALKGGGTLETWQCTFTTDGSAWKEKDPIPIGGLKKKVKAGAGIVAVGTDLYCTKGNKSNEFWQYIPGATLAMPQQLPQRDGVMAEKTAIALGTALEPNPLTSGFAVLRYGLTKAGAADLIVYNVAGQVVMERTLVAGRRGVVNLDLRHLSNGVYLVKFSSQDFENSHKLVVQR